MSRALTFVTWLLGCTLSYGQNIAVSFSGTGAVTKIDSVTAVNLTTSQMITLPGNDTLVLTGNTGIISVPEVGNSVRFFPNPFSGIGKLLFVASESQTVYIKVHNMAGQVVAETSSIVQPGENEFALSVNPAGIYMVSLITHNRTISYKVICNEVLADETRISSLGSHSANQGNLSQLKHKYSQANYSLRYNSRDIILYKCFGGIYTTLVTDSPTASKNYDVEFSACTDPDGRNYSVVNIGKQIWMAENLAYLPSVSPESSGSETSPYYYVYGCQSTDVVQVKKSIQYSKFGVLYNWEAAKTACPSGWHLPTDPEWITLYTFCGGYLGAGPKLKETGTINWNSPNTGATNSTGFSAIGCGKYHNGSFSGHGDMVTFWTSTINDKSWVTFYSLFYNQRDIFGGYGPPKTSGRSIRCIKD